MDKLSPKSNGATVFVFYFKQTRNRAANRIDLKPQAI